MDIIIFIIIFAIGIAIGFIISLILWLKQISDDITKLAIEIARIQGELVKEVIEDGECK